MKEQIERIKKYEDLMQEAEAALKTGQNSKHFRQVVRELEAYYASNEWKEDFAAEEEGRLPQTLKRGVLSEDGLYNLLELCRERMEERETGVKKTFVAVAVLFLLLTVLFSLIFDWTGSSAVFVCAVTFGTIAYHFVMRLCVGGAFQKLMNNEADYRKKWYQQKSWEKPLYRTLKVRKWKNKAPSFEPDRFDPEKHSLHEIAQAMCQAELVHETNMLLSFVPVAAAIWVGALPVFLITSVLAACLDLVFVIIQRYNRPRVIKLMERKKQQRWNDVHYH